MRVVFAVVVLSLIASTPSRADCGIPTWVGTWTESPIPTQGALYVYRDSSRGVDNWPALTWRGIGEAEAYPISPTVVRINYSGMTGSALTVDTKWEASYTYTLDARWHAPATAPRLLQFWHFVYEWTCSNADSLMLQVDQETAAFRVRWTPDDIRDEMLEFVMPAQTDAGRSALALGKINCGGISIPLHQLHGGGHLELVAIRLDRSEVAVTGIPSRIALHDLVPSEMGLGQALRLPPLALLDRAGIAPPVAPIRLPILAGILLVLSLGVWVVWRTRMRAGDSI